MREVSAAIFGFAVRAYRSLGVDPSFAMTQLSLARVDPRRRGARVDWDELATFLNRLDDQLGPDMRGPAALAYIEQNSHLRLLGRLPIPPRLFYRLIVVGTRPYHPHLSMNFRELPDGPCETYCELPEHFVGCELFFDTFALQHCHWSTVLGYETVNVERDVGSHHGRFRYRLPEPHGASGVVDAAGQRFEMMAKELVRMFGSAVGGGAPWRTAERLRRQYGLTDAEARVSIALAEGASVEGIAQAQNTSVSTVRSHLKKAYAKTGARGQAKLARLVLEVDRTPESIRANATDWL